MGLTPPLEAESSQDILGTSQDPRDISTFNRVIKSVGRPGNVYFLQQISVSERVSVRVMGARALSVQQMCC